MKKAWESIYKMNILILSCGTRNKLINYFKTEDSVKKVVVTDCSKEAPALYVADKFYIVPRMTSPDYLETIVDICQKEEINMVVPLQEDELLLIAKNRQIFDNIGVIPVISDYASVVMCKDKYTLNKHLSDKGIKSVPTYLAKEYSESFEKIFVKPRYGAGSVDTIEVKSKKLLDALIESCDSELIVQPKITGKEYGVDVYVDLVSKKVVRCFIKQKLRMRAGETEKSLSVKDDNVEKLVIAAVKELGLIGPVDVDVMEQNGEYYILEINPRFGGGYPHAFECGVNMPRLLATNAEGIANEVDLHSYKENVLAMKYTDILTRGI